MNATEHHQLQVIRYMNAIERKNLFELWKTHMKTMPADLEPYMKRESCVELGKGHIYFSFLVLLHGYEEALKELVSMSFDAKNA